MRFLHATGMAARVDRLGTALRTGLDGGMHLEATLYCPPFVLEHLVLYAPSTGSKDQGYRAVLGTDWSQRQVVEFETEDEAAAEAAARIRRREKRGYTAAAWRQGITTTHNPRRGFALKRSKTSHVPSATLRP